MPLRLVWTLFVALLAGLLVAAAPAAFAQGDGPIEPAPTAPGDIEIDQPPAGDGPIEPSEGEGDEQPIGEQPPPVEPTEPYRVDVQCSFASETGMTECAFTGVPPTGQTAAVFVVPAELICAEVTGGRYAWVAPDPVSGLNGYRPVGSEGRLTLVLAGVVTPAGAATYWFESPEGIVPGTGPALACSPAPSTQAPTPTPAPVPVAPTGSLLVTTLTCDDVPADREGYDWFGACEPIAYRLGPADAPVTPAAEATAQSEATVEALSPGTYDLEAMGFTWCHAVSDNVNPDSEVVIEPGARTTVWIFLCRDA